MGTCSAFRTEAMLHALLTDHGFRVNRLESLPDVTRYYHRADLDLTAMVERNGTRASVTLIRGESQDWWTCKPEVLRSILERELLPR